MPKADFFRQPLAEMIDPRHPLAMLAARLPWAQIEAARAPHFSGQVREGRAVLQNGLFGPSLQIAGAGIAAAPRRGPTHPPDGSPLYLKHAYKLSDEQLVERWAENVVWQHFSGMRFYEPRPPCDATQIGRFRTAIGEGWRGRTAQGHHRHGGVLQGHPAGRVRAAERDTAVQEKAIAHPVDSRLLEIPRHKVVAATKCTGVALKLPAHLDGN